MPGPATDVLVLTSPVTHEASITSRTFGNTKPATPVVMAASKKLLTWSSCKEEVLQLSMDGTAVTGQCNVGAIATRASIKGRSNGGANPTACKPQQQRVCPSKQALKWPRGLVPKQKEGHKPSDVSRQEEPGYGARGVGPQQLSGKESPCVQDMQALADQPGNLQLERNSRCQSETALEELRRKSPRGLSQDSILLDRSSLPSSPRVPSKHRTEPLWHQTEAMPSTSCEAASLDLPPSKRRRTGAQPKAAIATQDPMQPQEACQDRLGSSSTQGHSRSLRSNRGSRSNGQLGSAALVPNADSQINEIRPRRSAEVPQVPARDIGRRGATLFQSSITSFLGQASARVTDDHDAHVISPTGVVKLQASSSQFEGGSSRRKSVEASCTAGTYIAEQLQSKSFLPPEGSLHGDEGARRKSSRARVSELALGGERQPEHAKLITARQSVASSVTPKIAPRQSRRSSGSRMRVPAEAEDPAQKDCTSDMPDPESVTQHCGSGSIMQEVDVNRLEPGYSESGTAAAEAEQAQAPTAPTVCGDCSQPEAVATCLNAGEAMAEADRHIVSIDRDVSSCPPAAEAPCMDHQKCEGQASGALIAQDPIFEDSSVPCARTEGVLRRGDSPPLDRAAGSMPQEQLIQSVLEACDIFDERHSQYMQWHELDVPTAVDPAFLVGRQVRILWSAHDAWFLGEVKAFLPDTSQHEVHYQDEDKETLYLSQERVRLYMSAKENLPLPSTASLRAYAEGLRKEANRALAANKGQKLDEEDKRNAPEQLKARAAEIESLAQALEEVEHAEVIAEPAEKKRSKGKLQTKISSVRKPLSSDGNPSYIQDQPGAMDVEQPHSIQRESHMSTSILKDGQPDTLLEDVGQAQHGHEEESVVGGHSPVNSRIGEVVWGRERGWPHWPALVVSAQDAGLSKGNKGRGGSHRGGSRVYLHFFGSYDTGSPTDIVPFREGIHMHLHERCLKRSKAVSAIHEAMYYLKEGELPDRMIPLHNDEEWLDDDEEDEDTVGVGGSASCGFVLPKKWGSLTLHSLGRINYLHPRFHTDKYLYPDGFRSTRVLTSPAGGSKAVPHTFCITPDPDGIGPVFTITPKGGTSVQANDPRSAFLKLWNVMGQKPDSSAMTASVGRVFGLSKLEIREQIQRLPGANRCGQFCAWDGEPPKILPLTPEEILQRAEIEVGLNRLPQGMEPVSGCGGRPGTCCACGGEEEFHDDQLLQCDCCRQFVHMGCYGVEHPPDGGMWLCDVCQLGVSNRPACVLCPVREGIMKRTNCGRWCHSACAHWTPETVLDRETGLICGVRHISKGRMQLVCTLCSKPYGACIQCGATACCTAFHPLCARRAGYAMQLVHDEDAPHRETIRGKGGKARSRKKDGTLLEGGWRIMCFCPKHAPAAPSVPCQQKGENEQACTEGAHTITCHPTVASEPSSGSLDVSSRCRPYNHNLRRGFRAPDALAAALAKRAYVKALPYIVSYPRHTDISKLPESSCITADNCPPAMAHLFQTRKGPGRPANVFKTEAGSSKERPERGPMLPSVPCLSLAERFLEMRRTEKFRLTSGKSAIHGLGAFCKVSHKAGEMITEYVGELVRPPVADARERKVYDRLVGAGTYVFALNEEFCVDATSQGNIAHLLNHSCAPNCFSRTITVRSSADGPLQDHVVIYASRDIAAGEEVTYDYRFSGSERLPCNCGAATCRGFVNMPSRVIWVPRRLLKPWHSK